MCYIYLHNRVSWRAKNVLANKTGESMPGRARKALRRHDVMTRLRHGVQLVTFPPSKVEKTGERLVLANCQKRLDLLLLRSFLE